MRSFISQSMLAMIPLSTFSFPATPQWRYMPYMVPHKEVLQRQSAVKASGSDTCAKKKVYHFNHAGASPSPDCVLDAQIEHLKLEQQIGAYAAAESAKDALDDVYLRLAALLNCKSKEIGREIALTDSATRAWNELFETMARAVEMDTSRDSTECFILVSQFEYAAQLATMCRWCQEHPNWKMLQIPSTRTGQVDLTQLDIMLRGEFKFRDESSTMITLKPENIRMVCITHIPTNCGLINPVGKVGESIEEYLNTDEGLLQCFYLVDATQSIGHIPVDVQQIQCHGLCGTGRKYLRGPRGTGFLFCRDDIVDRLPAANVDHACSPLTELPTLTGDSLLNENVKFRLRKGARARFELWESNIAAKLGLGAAIRFLQEEVGPVSVTTESIRSRTSILRSKLLTLPSVDVLHHNVASSECCGIVVLSCKSISALALKELLWNQQCETTVTPATSTPIDSAVKRRKDLLRISVSYFTQESDIDELVKRLNDILVSPDS